MNDLNSKSFLLPLKHFFTECLTEQSENQITEIIFLDLQYQPSSIEKKKRLNKEESE